MSMVRERSRTVPGTRDLLQARLPGLRAALEQEREFRVEQLADLAAGLHRDRTTVNPSDSTDSRVLREISQMLAAGARHAWAALNGALNQMEIGGYGLCAACGQRISLTILRAVSQATVCLGCRTESDTTVHGAAEP